MNKQQLRQKNHQPLQKNFQIYYHAEIKLIVTDSVFARSPAEGTFEKSRKGTDICFMKGCRRRRVEIKNSENSDDLKGSLQSPQGLEEPR